MIRARVRGGLGRWIAERLAKGIAKGIGMLLDRLMPSRCNRQSDALRRASELHALSTLVIGSEARKTRRRVADFKVTADAAERRSRERTGDGAVRTLAAGVLLRLGPPRERED